MSFSLIKPDEATLRYDPLDVYESAIRFLSDVVFAGLVKRIPIDFAPVKGAPPLIPLVPALKWLTTLFNADLITENQRQPDFLSHQLHQMKVWCLPPILHDTNGLIRDPINGKYWTEIRSGILSTIGTLESFGKANTANALATVPKLTARVLFSVYGIPKKLTKAFFIVVQVEEFWSMITALKDWVDRHNVALKVELISNPDATPLHGKLLVLTTPKSDGVQQVAEAKVLQTKIREKKTIVNPEQLISSRRQEDGRVTVSAHSLFSRRRPVIKIEEAQSDNNLGQH